MNPQPLYDHLRRYQVATAERALATERLRAAFGEQTEATPEIRFELNDTPAMAVAGN